MTERMSHEEHVASVRAELVVLAHSMLSGSLPYLEGAIRVVKLRRAAEVPDRDPEFEAFVVIESETDHLPIGRIRSLWSSEALARLGPEIEKSEQWAKELATPACRSLIERFDA